MQEPKKPRKKKCKWCKDTFQPSRQFQEVCQPFPCGIELAKGKGRKKDAADLRERKSQLKPNTHWLKATQTVVNAYVVLRDKAEPCISCRAWDVEEFHAGHYRSRGAASHLRFNLDNLHKQCSQCNTHLSGNQVEYRRHLVAKIGKERVLALENSNEPRKWDYEELKAIRADFKGRAKELEAGL
jgi:hypothetical protein